LALFGNGDLVGVAHARRSRPYPKVAGRLRLSLSETALGDNLSRGGYRAKAICARR